MEEYLEFDRLAGQHERRRGTGLPTLSTLVGDVPLARRLWCRWVNGRGGHPVVVRGGTLNDWFHAWVEELIRSRDVYRDAERYLERRLCRSDTSKTLAHRTTRELELDFERAGLDDRRAGVDGLCRWLLLRRAGGQSLSVDDLIHAQLSGAGDASGAVAAQNQLLGMLPAGAAPALMVACDDLPAPGCGGSVSPSRMEVFQERVRELAALVTGVPQLTAAVAVSDECWDEYVTCTPECFAKAVVREHVLSVRGWTADRIRQAVFAVVPSGVDQLADVIAEVVRIGPSTSLVESLAVALKSDAEGWGPAEGMESGKQPRETVEERLAQEHDPWKSAQERFLFQLLEHTADLAGRFLLNVDPGLAMVNHPVEVDLLCADLKIAVEIDGYYHFTDPGRYRRDRRKDVVLQRCGFLVLRFLAEDIVPRMRTVLETIREAVRWRESQLPGRQGRDAQT